VGTPDYDSMAIEPFDKIKNAKNQN